MKERKAAHWPLVGLIAVVLLSGLVGGLVGGLVIRLTTEREEPAAAELGQRAVVQEGSAITEAVARAVPAVVKVVTEQHPREDALGRVLEETAVGSGVVIDPRGYVVTNEHVVRDAVSLTVVLHNGQEYAASLVDEDGPFTDVAVLKIDRGRKFEAIPFGDSDALTLGETVVAVGTALMEFDSTVTVGVVSGLHRRWSRNGVVMEDLVQTDAAINHGNSGGALLNTRGELVGLNWIVIRSTEEGQVVEGVAFALSSNTVAPIVETTIEEGSYPRAFLGVTHRDLTPDVSLVDAPPTDHGALVTSVSPGTPADESGLRAGDIIVRMGDQALDGQHPFINVLRSLQPGEAVPFVIYRDGARLTVEVTMGRR